MPICLIHKYSMAQRDSSRRPSMSQCNISLLSGDLIWDTTFPASCGSCVHQPALSRRQRSKHNCPGAHLTWSYGHGSRILLLLYLFLFFFAENLLLYHCMCCINRYIFTYIYKYRRCVWTSRWALYVATDVG